MAKNYESESKNTKDYTGMSDRNCFKNETDRTENLKTTNKTNSKNKTTDKTTNKTSQSYDDEETSRY